MPKKLSAQPVRAVILQSAIGALGEDDELHTSLELQGLTAAWIPGDHGLCLLIGGARQDGVQIEPALTVLLPPMSTEQLSSRFSQAAPEDLGVSARCTGGSPALTLAVAESHHVAARAARDRRRVSTSWNHLGASAWVVTYQLAAASLRFSERPFVMDISVLKSPKQRSFRFRVFLSADEVADLKVVLRHTPEWPWQS
jgi:hypothetical protein